MYPPRYSYELLPQTYLPHNELHPLNYELEWIVMLVVCDRFSIRAIREVMHLENVLKVYLD